MSRIQAAEGGVIQFFHVGKAGRFPPTAARLAKGGGGRTVVVSAADD